MLKTQEQRHTNFEEFAKSFDGILFIIKHAHRECCAGFITANRWQFIFRRRSAIAMALYVLDAELIRSIGMLDADEEGKYTGPTGLNLP
jgi:hypothetical protein